MTEARVERSGDWFATGCEATFYKALRRGDVLLFEGYDDMAALGIFLERRPVYHSALWWGPVNGHQCAVHNVSDLWWDNAARLALDPDGTKGKLTDDEKALALVEYWLCGTASKDAAKDETSPVGKAVRKLLAKGGVAPFSVDRYLNETFKEQGIKRHKIRSITALRYPSSNTEATSSALASRVAQAAHEVNEDGFPAAELVAALPHLFERSGYDTFGAGWLRGRIRSIERPLLYGMLRAVAKRKYHSSKARGWICAMFVDKVYWDAGIDLKLVGIDLPGWPDRFVTPRDLIDSPNLAPLVTLLVKPEPVPREGEPRKPNGSATKPSDTLDEFPYDLSAPSSG
jgi:hypothetical protein